MESAVFGGSKTQREQNTAGTDVFCGNVGQKLLGAVLHAEIEKGGYHFLGITLPPAGGMDAVANIPAHAALFDDGATGAHGLVCGFILGNEIVAILAVAQMP